MPSVVKIRVEKGRDLPPMDRNASPEFATDAFVEVRLEKYAQRTSTCRRTLHPTWNEEFQFDFIDDSIMQDEPLELRCMDQDIASSKLIGVAYVDLNPLIMRTNESDKDLVISGWFPLFDTARGVRGSIYVTVRLQFIGNENPFLDSSAGIQFFSSSTVSPRAFFVQDILGFVDELVIQDDPENRWQDYFMRSKTSNDNRMKALHALTAEVRRKLGKKVFDLGGNAVLGYAFALDTEGGSGIIARARGTACRLLKVLDSQSFAPIEIPRAKFNSLTARHPEWQNRLRNIGKTAFITREDAELLAPRLSRSSSAKTAIAASKFDPVVLLHSVDDETITATQLLPLAASQLMLTTHEKSSAREAAVAAAPELLLLESGKDIFQQDVALLTLDAFPSHVTVKLGGLVCARSVKFLGGSGGGGSGGGGRGAGAESGGVSEEDTQQQWWKELREEISSHAKTLCCRFVIGYSERCTMYGDVCILSAVGTAAQLKGLSQSVMATPLSLTQHALSSNNNGFGSIPQDALFAGISGSPAVPSTRRESGAVDLPANPLSLSLALSRSESQRGLASLESNAEHSLALSPSPPPRRERDRDRERWRDREPSLSPERESPSPAAPSLSRQHTAHSHASQGSAAPTPSARSANTTSASNAAMKTASHPHNGTSGQSGGNSGAKTRHKQRCGAAHVPYNHNTAPFSFMRLVPCLLCRRKWVPETLLSSTDLPAALATRGAARLVDVTVCRLRKAAPGKGEADAAKISQILPFLEYDVQRQLVLKLKVLGRNAAFGYSCKIHVSSEIVVATALCTAVYLEALPPPPALAVARGAALSLSPGGAANAAVGATRYDDEARVLYLQRQIEQRAQSNRDALVASACVVASNTTGASGVRNVPTMLDTVPERESEKEKEREKERERETHSDGESSSSSTSSSSSSSAAQDSSGEGEGDSSSLESPSSSSSSESESEREREREGDTSRTRSSTVESEAHSLAQMSRTRSMRPARDSARSSLKDESRTASVRAGSASDMRGVRRRLLPMRGGRQRHLGPAVFVDDRPPFVFELDEETDADLRSVLADWVVPPGYDVVNVSRVSGNAHLVGCGRTVTVCRRGKLYEPKGSRNNGQQLSTTLRILFTETYMSLCHVVRAMTPCHVLSLCEDVNVIEDGQIEIVLTATVHRVSGGATVYRARGGSDTETHNSVWVAPRVELWQDIHTHGHTSKSSNLRLNHSRSPSVDLSMTLSEKADAHSFAHTVEGFSEHPYISHLPSMQEEEPSPVPVARSSRSSTQYSSHTQLALPSQSVSHLNAHGAEVVMHGPEPKLFVVPESMKHTSSSPTQPTLSKSRRSSALLSQVLLSPLTDIPGARVKRYLGPLQLHFIKDVWNVRTEGSVDSHYHTLLCEVQAIARAHVAALGGNALLCQRLVPQEAGGRSRNLGFNLFSFSGDVVLLEFSVDVMAAPQENSSTTTSAVAEVVVDSATDA